ncbi:hypothetical protein [Paenibacillus amylolyticus]|uniref:hypothetical protein n=1 Tax=Paenibacillus amylolyticus TaxID=1451 RepID=UPI00201DC58C|nr:hypothetical protein [Paenibacillus amylolyticus]MCL6663397.1 hypothetical protein [Paenibacillus amylolyticus]
MEINLKINKISFNSSQHLPKEEDIEVEIVSKFGVAKDNILSRAFFFEININAVDAEGGQISRSLILDAAFQYNLLGAKSNASTKEDDVVYGECLKILNEKIELFTSQGQDSRQPFNIKTAIDEFESK